MSRHAILALLVFGLSTAGAVNAQTGRDPEMVKVPPGSFMMGPAPGEEEREGVPRGVEAGPTHKVSIGYSFSIGKYEVTRAQFKIFAEATGHPDGDSCYTFDDKGKYAEVLGRNWRNPGIPQTESDPVVCVSWNDADAYVAWLNKENRTTGKPYRLPSEAEWEYAARGGKQTARYWGDSRDGACGYGNFADLTAAEKFGLEKTKERIFGCSDGYAYTAPVGKFKPNDFELHDMLGNAAEWVADCLHANYDRAPTDGSAWLADNCKVRMLRGGSWYGNPGDARAAARSSYYFSADYRLSNLGFRVARTN